MLHSHGQHCLSCAVPTSEPSLIGSEIGVYTATEKRPDFKLICKIFLPKCVCLRGSAPDPAGGLTAPPDPAGKGWVYTTIRPPTFVSGSTPLGDIDVILLVSAQLT